MNLEMFASDATIRPARHRYRTLPHRISTIPNGNKKIKKRNAPLGTLPHRPWRKGTLIFVHGPAKAGRLEVFFNQ
jgi:hypothetical protein